MAFCGDHFAENLNPSMIKFNFPIVVLYKFLNDWIKNSLPVRGKCRLLKLWSDFCLCSLVKDNFILVFWVKNGFFVRGKIFESKLSNFEFWNHLKFLSSLMLGRFSWSIVRQAFKNYFASSLISGDFEKSGNFWLLILWSNWDGFFPVKG